MTYNDLHASDVPETGAPNCQPRTNLQKKSELPI